MNTFTLGDSVRAITRDFESMNLMPPHPRLTEKRASLVPGMTNIWYEYVPECYDGTTPMPLIVQFHGGGNDGRRWVDYTLWHALAETKGYIVLYPNSPEYESWACTDLDVQYICDLIELTCQNYRIDRTRIFVQGMSNGEMMTLAFTLQHPELLAAAGNTTGPSPEEMIGDDKPVGALPLIQMRGEKDIFFQLTEMTPYPYEKRYHMNDINRELWQEVNGLDTPPALHIRGKDNFLRFPGRSADLINWEIKDMGHREPPEAAQVYWDYLYSGCRRVDGKVVMGKPDKTIEGDDDTVILSLGSSKLYKKNAVIAANVPGAGVVRLFKPAPAAHFAPFSVDEMLETSVLCAPAEFFEAAFGAKVEYINPGDAVRVTLGDGKIAEFYANSMLIKYDGEYRGLKKPCCLVCGLFYVPIGEFCADILGKSVSVADGAMCISDHYCELGRYTARILRGYLGGVRE